MDDETRARIAGATVRFSDGEGVIVPGNLIVTAAHVLREWSSAGGMALGDVSLEEIRTADGTTITAVVMAVEPIADIAVLGAPDEYKLAMAYEAAIEGVIPVPLCTDDFPLFVRFPAHVFTHTDHWVTVQAVQCAVNAPNLAFSEASDGGIAGSTSGGPVVTEAGHLIGVVSTAGGTDGADSGIDGMVPRVHLAVPEWR